MNSDIGVAGVRITSNRSTADHVENSLHLLTFPSALAPFSCPARSWCRFILWSILVDEEPPVLGSYYHWLLVQLSHDAER